MCRNLSLQFRTVSRDIQGAGPGQRQALSTAVYEGGGLSAAGLGLERSQCVSTRRWQTLCLLSERVELCLYRFMGKPGVVGQGLWLTAVHWCCVMLLAVAVLLGRCCQLLLWLAHGARSASCCCMNLESAVGLA